MRKNEFEQKVLAFVSEYLGEGYDVKIDHVKKDNAASYRAVIIGKDYLKISSTLNIDQLFSITIGELRFSRSQRK